MLNWVKKGSVNLLSLRNAGLAAMSMIFVFAAGNAYAACSGYKGLATINEVHRKGNSTRFVEVKLLDASISSTVWNTWNIKICAVGNLCSSNISLSNAITTNMPWLVIDKPDITNRNFIDIKNGMDVILTDANGNTIDYLSVAGYVNQQDASCTPAYDWTMGSTTSSDKTIERSPDGTGDWQTTGSGNSGGNTTTATNDEAPGGGAAPVVSVSNITVVKGQTASFVLSIASSVGYNITVSYKTLDDTAAAGTDYTAVNGTATITAGATSTTVDVVTNASSSSGKVQFKLNLFGQVNGTLVNNYPIATILAKATPVVCSVTTIPGAGDLKGVSGSSTNNVVAVGDDGEIYRYNGTAWVAETSPTGQEYNAVSVIDANTAVAVGENGVISIYSGGTWTASNSGTGQDLHNVWAYSSTDIYAVGDNGTLLYFNGTTWTDVSAAAGTGGDEIVGVWGDSSAFYALGEDGDLYRYDRSAGTWSTISTCASVVADEATALWGDGAGNIYMTSESGGVYRYDGTSCSLLTTSTNELKSISGNAATGEIYAVGENGTVLYFNGTSWTESTVGTQDYNSVWVSPDGVPFYVGDSGSAVTCTSASALSYFLIGHDKQGLNCLSETISVTAKQSDGSTYSGYTGSIVLDTQSSSGTWTLNTGTAANFADATANDGLAAYTFAAANNGVATFNLDYRSGTASIDVDAYDGSTRDNDSEGNLVFSPSGFTVTAASLVVPFLGAVNTVIPAQTAATSFQLYLAAYGTTPTDPTCGIIESYAGAKNLKFWSTYNNPGTGTLPVSVNAVNAFANETAANAGASQSVTFTNGQAAITTNYADVGQITLAMKDNTVTADLPTGIRGNSNAFVVKPAGFALSAIQRSSDSFANPATATDQNGTAFMAAGGAFSATVTAVNSLGNVTPNYGQESTAESVLLTPAIVAAGAANNPAIAFSTGFDGFVSGVDTGVDFRWDEVGIITLTPSVADGDYLGAGDITGTTSANVGRFYPDHFTTTVSNGSFANACVTAAAFTYLGESFAYLSSPVVTATANTATNTIASNYTGVWAKLGVAGVSLTYPSADNSQLDENGSLAIALTSTAGALSRTDNANGSLTFTLGGASADSFAYDRSAGQVPPFTSDVTISLTAVNDGEATANDTPRNIKPVGNLQRFGRGYAQDAYGTMSLVGDSLTLPIGSWYFNASSNWVLNTDDSCSSYTYSKVDSSIASTAAPASAVTLSSGVGDLTLTLINAGNPGGSSIVSTVWPAWLRFDYDGVDQLSDSNLYDDNASATATFGIFRSDDRYLYWREAP